VAFPCQAATYYISSSEGSDTNDGLSPSRPWKNLFKVSLESQPGRIKAGDSILLKRGDVWEGQMRFYARGTAAAPMLLGAYGSGAKPIIYGDGRGLEWTAVSGYQGVFTAYVGEASIMQFVYQENQSYSRVTPAGSIATAVGLDDFLKSLTPGSWGIAGNTNRIWIRTRDGTLPNTIRAFRASSISVWSGSSHAVVENLDLRETNVGVDVTTSDFITIRDLDTLNTQNIAVYFRWDVTNSIMERNNVKNAGNTALYILTGANNIIRNNAIDGVYSTISGITAVSDECGIGLQQSKGNLVEYNQARNVRGSAADYYFEVDTVVRYNYFEHGIYPHGTNLLVYGNIVNVPVGSPYAGMNLGNIGNLPIKIFHNTFFMPVSYAVMARQRNPDMVGGAGPGEVIFRNNIIVATGNTNLVFFDDKVDSDYNCFYSPMTPKFNYNKTGYNSLSAYQNASGKDLHSIFIDPKLTTDLKPGANSGCLNAGIDVSNLIEFPYKDFASAVIPQGAAPDMGAYEFSSTAPALSVSLTPSTSVGLAPLNKVSLTAKLNGTAIGPVNYFFYCNRSTTDTDTPTANATVSGSQLTNYTAADACSYAASGIYTAKVVVQRGGLSAESKSLVVVTPPADTTPPVIFSVVATPASTSATITWNTDEWVSRKVEYGATTSYGSSQSIGDVSKPPFSLVLTKLTPTTLYHFRIKSTDMFGNEAVSANYTFSTNALIPSAPINLKVTPP